MSLQLEQTKNSTLEQKIKAIEEKMVKVESNLSHTARPGGDSGEKKNGRLVKSKTFSPKLSRSSKTGGPGKEMRKITATSRSQASRRS